MVWAKMPEGYQSPGYVIVSIFTPEGKDAVINVYGMHETKKEADKERRRMIQDQVERERSTENELMKRWSLFVRKVADIPQMNRLMDEQEKKTDG